MTRQGSGAGPPVEASSQKGGAVERCARLVVSRPGAVLGALACVLCASVALHFQLIAMRDGLVFIPSHNEDLFRDFPAASDPSHDAFVFWCEGCNLLAEPEFAAQFEAASKTLDRLSKESPECGDLEWSSYEFPAHGLPADVYLSKDNSTSFLEFHFTSKRCMMTVRRALKKLSSARGKVLSAEGGPETAAAASMEAEFRTSLEHSMVAMPICACILWLVAGNVFRATTPLLVVGSSFLTGQAAVVVCKAVFPRLDVNFDDSMALFVILALSVDYMLFFWSRFNQEREKCPNNVDGYREAVAVGLYRSSQVILVSNVFVTMAYGVTMVMPHMNLWAYLALYIECMVGCAAAAFYSVTLVPTLAVMLPSIFDQGRCPLDATQQKVWQRLPDSQAFWSSWARCITRRPAMVVVPVVAYACMLPFVALLVKYRASYDVEVSGLRDDILEPQALRRFENNFNMGMLFPTTLVLEAKYLGPVPHAATPTGDVASFMQLFVKRTEGRPLTWQDVLQSAEAEDVSQQKEEDDSQAIYLMKRSPKRGLKLAQECLAQPGATSFMTRDRFRMHKDLALSAEFGRVVCQVAETLVEGSRGSPWEVDVEDILSIWWMPHGVHKLVLDGLQTQADSPKEGAASLASDPSQRKEIASAGSLAGLMDGDSVQDNMRKEVMAHELMARVPAVLQQSVSMDGNKILLKVSNRFRPSSPEAYQLDRFIRKNLQGKKVTFDVQDRRYALHVRHQSCMQVSVDAGTALLHAAPRALVVFAPLVGVAVGLSFGSAFLALKLALTVIVPILTTYGLSVAVYQMNALDFLGVKMWMGTGGLDYRVMMLSGAILFGFAMDYDLFLFVRVYEHRQDGYDNTSAVRRALAETGPVITTAGTMMAVSFFFLMCAHTVFVRIMGFIFFVGVVLDVFVVRMTLAPVFLSLAENLNYWPSKMPEVSKSWH